MVSGAGEDNGCSTPPRVYRHGPFEGPWSDPRKASSSGDAGAQMTLDDEDYGIDIPSFLQPLLGLDFVPYLPSVDVLGVMSMDETKLTDDDLENLEYYDLPAESPATNDDTRVRYSKSASLELPKAAADDRGLLDEGIEPPTISETTNSKETSPRKKLWRPKGKFLKRVRGRIKGRGASRKGRADTWNGASPLGSREVMKALDPNADERKTKHSSKWYKEQHARLAEHQAHLARVVDDAQAMNTRTKEIQDRIEQVKAEMTVLQKAMSVAEKQLQKDFCEYENARSEVCRLQTAALDSLEGVIESIRLMQMQPPGTTGPAGMEYPDDGTTPSDVIELASDGTPSATSVDIPLQLASGAAEPLRRRAATAPAVVRLDSFMRVSDLTVGDDGFAKDVSNFSSSQSSLASAENTRASGKSNDFIFVDQNITPILQGLSRLGYQVATDESDRFVPTRDTEKLLAKYEKKSWTDNVLDDWPIARWKVVHDNDVLVWTGSIGHTGFGSDWPVVKARGLVQASPRALLEYMMDSSKIKQYNKMSQGRDDIVTIQKNVDTAVEESDFGFPGTCKVVRALNRPRFLPTTIEMLSLTYSKHVEEAPGSYMSVSRSVFEDDSGEHKSQSAYTIRSEMLLGVLLIRPADKDHTVSEFTTITHVYSPGVPEMIARRAAPSSAMAMMKDVQNVFLTEK